MGTAPALWIWILMIACSLASAFPPDVAAQKDLYAEGEGLPIHATFYVRGRAKPDDFCQPHGFIIMWEGDLEPVDDDPEGIMPARLYEGDGPFTTLKFDNYTCEGDPPCNNVVRPGPNPSGVARLNLVRDTWDGKLDRTPNFEISGFEVGYFIDCHTAQTGTEPMSLDFDIAWEAQEPTPPLTFSEEDFEQGFQRTYHRSDQEEYTQLVSYCQGPWEATLTLSYKQDPEKPKVEIAGCAHLLLGGSEQLTATGTPSGGRYRWSSETPSVLSVSGTESSTEAKAGEPGHATVRVEYEARNGKKAEATLPGSVVDLKLVNYGFPIPTIYLYDEEGHAKPALEVPIKQEPPDGDLLFFEAADLSVATVSNSGSSLTITGKSAGSTTAQAKTKCGEATGPVLTLTVENCSPETVAKLRERYQEARKKFDESASRVTKDLSSKDYIEASDKIGEDIADAAIKTADVAVTVGSAAGHASEAAEVAEHIIGGGALGWDAAREEAKTIAIKHAISVLVPGSAGMIMTYELIHSWGTLIKHAEKLVEVDDKLTEEQIAQNKLSWELEHINALIEKCKKGSQPGQPPAHKEPTKPKPKPEPPKGKKGKEEPSPQEPPTTREPGEPGGTKPPSVEPPPPPPPPPPPRAGTAGLPIDCGCKDASTAAWKSEESGLAAIAVSLGLLQACAENYGAALESFRADSAGMAQTMSAIEKALETPGAKGFGLFRQAVPGLQAAKTSLEKLTKASEEFSSTLRGCDKKVPEAVGIMNKAGQTLGTPPEMRSK